MTKLIFLVRKARIRYNNYKKYKINHIIFSNLRLGFNYYQKILNQIILYFGCQVANYYYQKKDFLPSK